MQVLFGANAEDISSDYGISRSYAYRLGQTSADVLVSMENVSPSSAKILLFDSQTIRRTIVSLALDEAYSIEVTQRFMENIYGIYVSIGKISGFPGGSDRPFN